MGTPWCGFSELARKSANNRTLLIAGALVFGIGWVGLSSESAWARRRPASIQASPTPAPSEGAALAAFAALPALEVEPAPAPSAAPSSAPRVGDRLEMRAFGLSAPQPGNPVVSGVQLQLPPGASPLAEQGWALFVAPRDESRNTDDFHFIAVPLKAGELVLPSLALVDAQGKAFARTNPFKLTVASAIRADDPKPQEPEPPRPPVSLPYPWWVVVLGGICALALVGAGIYYLIRWSRARRKAPAVPLPVGPRLTEDEEALAAFDELEKQGLARRGEFKKHYFRVSEVLKNYIGARYSFDAPESTSREILVELKRQKADRLRPPGLEGGNLDDSGMERLERLLDSLDLVKFTDHAPQSGEPAEVLAVAREFVMVTRRVKVGLPKETIKAP